MMIRKANDETEAGMMMDLTVAVIIARGGSKGLPRKNLLPLCGKPLVAWSIIHALGSHMVDEVILSSDDEEILDVGRSYGIACCKRPIAVSDDKATVDSAARHGIEAWEREHGRQCRYIALLYGNVPVRPDDLTDRALDRLIETGADSVQSVYPVGAKHPYWMRRLTGESADVLENWQPNEIYRRQELPPCYMLNSGILACTRESFFNVDPAHPHSFLGRDRRAIVTREEEVIDIDSKLDLIVAQALLEQSEQRLATPYANHV